jgi:hypothetical protein
MGQNRLGFGYFSPFSIEHPWTFTNSQHG